MEYLHIVGLTHTFRRSHSLYSPFRLSPHTSIVEMGCPRAGGGMTSPIVAPPPERRTQTVIGPLAAPPQGPCSPTSRTTTPTSSGTRRPPRTRAPRSKPFCHRG